MISLKEGSTLQPLRQGINSTAQLQNTRELLGGDQVVIG